MFLQPAAGGAISIEGSGDKTFTPVDPRIMLDSFPSSPHNIRCPLPQYTQYIYQYKKVSFLHCESYLKVNSSEMCFPQSNLVNQILDISIKLGTKNQQQLWERKFIQIFVCGTTTIWLPRSKTLSLETLFSDEMRHMKTVFKESQEKVRRKWKHILQKDSWEGRREPARSSRQLDDSENGWKRK